MAAAGRAKNVAVDVEPDAGIDAVVGQAERRAEAADVDRRVARVGREELDGRHQFLEAVHVERAAVGHPLAADDRDRNGNLLRDFLDPPGSDDDGLGEARGTQGQVDRGGLAALDRNPAHGGIEPVQPRFHAIRPGRDDAGEVRAVLVSDGLDGGAGLLVDDPKVAPGMAAPDESRTTMASVPLPSCAPAEEGSSPITNTPTSVASLHRMMSTAGQAASAGPGAMAVQGLPSREAWDRFS